MPWPGAGDPRGPDAVGLRLAIGNVVLGSTRALAMWLAILFAAFAVTDTLLFAAPVDRILAGYDLALGAGYAVLWLTLRRGRISPRHAGTLSASVLLAALPYILTVLWLTGQPLQSSGLALWQVACGLFLLSWPWLVTLLLVSDLAWLAVVARLPPDPEWSHYGTLLLTANVLAFVAHGVRSRTSRRLESLRLRDRARQAELEAALAEARTVGEVRRLSDLKTRFMNVAAHELATPMTPIMIHIRLLRDLDGLPARARHSVEVLERNLDRLNRLLRDILDGSRLQADKLPMTMVPHDLRRVLEDCVESYAPVAAGRGVRLRIEAGPPMPVVGDPARLTQVVTNLVSNAVKFTPAGRRVDVAGTSGPQGTRVEVRDEGAGFPPEQGGQLFQPFSQLHEPDAERRGTGLGLYISKGIVERHGGAIGAHSAGPGKGASFWFTLPAA